MTMECYFRNCEYHGPVEEGPFCHELYCKKTRPIVILEKDGVKITAVVNEDGSVPTFEEAIKR
jgi:hypothetical protein